MSGSAGGPNLGVVSAAEEKTLNHEVLFQIWTAQMAWANLEGALQVPKELEPLRERGPGAISGMATTSPEFRAIIAWQVRVWLTVRVILSAAAVVSLTLWPITKKTPKGAAEIQRAARAEELRKRWSLPKDSILADRDVRDVFEHVDERLVQWMDTYNPSKLTGLLIDLVPPGGPTDPGSAFRILDPQTKVVWAGGKKCDLGAIMAELDATARKLPALRHVLNVGFPPPK